MRIIAGKHGSRRLKSLAGNVTRPTLDQVKEAFFNRLGPYFTEEESWLDLFAGSGALGLEFLSRGGGQAIFVDKSPAAMAVVKENIGALKEEDKSLCINKSYASALARLDRKVSYAYLDPPYHFKDLDQVMDQLRGHLDKESLVFIEQAKEEKVMDFVGYELVRSDIYGVCHITWYQKKSDD